MAFKTLIWLLIAKSMPNWALPPPTLEVSANPVAASFCVRSNKDWFNLDKQNYLKRKKDFLNKISLELECQFDIVSENWLHRELATP